MVFLCDDMRHLICVPYSREGLHAMAATLGIKRCWFHRDHYDIPKKRIAEIQSKCVVVSIRTINTLIVRYSDKMYSWKSNPYRKIGAI